MQLFISSVNAWMAIGPKCFRWRAENPSGPMAGEFFACLMASDTWALVKIFQLPLTPS